MRIGGAPTGPCQAVRPRSSIGRAHRPGLLAKKSRSTVSWPACGQQCDLAARKAEQLEDNIGAVDLRLSDEDVRLLDAASDPGIPYPKWMVLQLDTAEDPRSKALYPERYVDGGPWKDLRGTRWSG